MSFREILQSIVDECGGGLAAALMGIDGIAIEQVRASELVPGSDPLHGDVSRAGIEFGRILQEMHKASEALGTGRFEEAVVSLERARLVFHDLDDEIMLVLALLPDGNLGKARYLLRRNAVALRELL